MDKSLDQLISEKKASGGGKGRKGGKGGKGSKGNKGDKPQKGGRGGGVVAAGRAAGAGRDSAQKFGGRQAGGGKGARAQPYQEKVQRGRGGGGGRSNTIIERSVVNSARAPVKRTRVFVTGLPFDWEQHDILRVMETTGEVENLTIYWDAQGRATGNALVTYKSERGAKEAVHELDGAKLGNSEITVTTAKEGQGEQPARNGGGGGGGGGKARGAGKGSKGSSKGASKGAKGGNGGGRGNGNGARTKQFGRQQGGGRGQSKAKIEKKQLSTAQLDQQLTTFFA